MAVSSVDSSSRQQEIQNIKDAYDEREKSLVDRQNRQLAETEKRHERTVNELRDRFDQQLSDDKDKIQTLMSDKEKKHVKDIQDLQNASRQKMSKMMEEDYNREQNADNSFNRELTNQKEQATKTENRLDDSFKREMSRKDQETSDMEEHYRTGSQEALKAQARRLQEHFEQERDELNKHFTQTLGEKDRELDSTRKQKYADTMGLKTDKETQKNQLIQKYGALLENEQKKYDKSLTKMEEGLSFAVAQNKERYRQQMEKNNEDYAQNFQSLKSAVDERVDRDVKSQRLINEGLAAENSFDKAKMTQDAAVQRANLIAEYKKSFDELEARRLASVQDGNRMKKEEVEAMHAKHNRAIQKLNEESISKFNDFKSKVDGEYSGQIDEVVREKTIAQIQHDNARKKLTQTYAESLTAQAEFHDDQIDAARRDGKRLADDQRATLEKQHGAEVSVLREKMMKQSVDNQQKLADMNEKYENLITTMRADYEKKFRKQAEAFRDETDKQMKYAAMDREATESKFESRLSQMKENFERETEQIRRRQNQERTDAALNKKA